MKSEWSYTSMECRGTTLPFILSETFEMKRNEVKREEREECCGADGVLFFLYVVDKTSSNKDV
jgi:hypothetical protein